MSTFFRLVQQGTFLLEKAGIEEAGLDAWLLLEYTIKKNRAWYLAHQQEEAPDQVEKRYMERIRRREKRIPLQHITGQAFFMGYEFFVNEKALIPRQDTEILVEEALKVLNTMESPGILDMCTGSGCILLSLLLEKKESWGVGADISQEALEVAEKNKERLGLADRGRFVESSLFLGEWFQKEAALFDVIVSNPPYIKTKDIESLMEEVRLHDPRLALDGGEDGLCFYQRITSGCLPFLKEGGWLMYEIGSSQGEAVARIMEKEGFGNIQIKKDLSGLDRVVIGSKEKTR